MSRETLITQALRCIDEANAALSSADKSEYHAADFLDEAARWVVKVVPVHTLGAGTDFSTNTMTGNKVTLPSNFVRIIAFQMSDWLVPATTDYHTDSPLYEQQSNPVLRGSISRPMVFILNGDSQMEYYSTEETTPSITTAKAFCFSTVDNNYPDKLYDITAWRTAELVFTAMNDQAAIALCQNKIKEILAVL